MELRDYIAIFRKQRKTFWTIVLLSVLVTVIWQKNQPIQYQATLLLNVGRTGTQSTEAYTYDSFYRLQADERFADTVVRWLASPRVVEDIYGAAGIDPRSMDLRSLEGAFKAKRLSSQMIEVTYRDASGQALQKIAGAVTVTLNRYTESLNMEDREPNWFVIIKSDPVIRDARQPLLLTSVVGLIFGLFMGFWISLIRHYFQGDAHRD